VIIGIISDVHANIIALEAVVEELRGKGADTIMCLGDLVGYGPSPNETIDFIKEEKILCTLGAADERIAFDFINRERRRGVADQTLEWTKDVIEDRHITYLRNLPVLRRLETPFGRAKFFHGSPETPAERTSLQREPLALVRLLDVNRCNILAAGGSHVPYKREVATGWVVNPGSVGLSLNGEPGADYALLTIEEHDVSVKMGKVEYDFAAVAFDIVAWGLPTQVADAIQHGRMTEGP
jgi:putative phosphoesterase